MSKRRTPDLLVTHQSTAKNTPVGERFEAFEQATEDMAYAVYSVSQLLNEVVDSRKSVDSLEDLFAQRTNAQLRDLLKRAGYERVPQGPKKRLVEMALQAIPADDPYSLLGIGIVYGADYIRQVRDLLNEGGRRTYAKVDVHTLGDLMRPLFPLVAFSDIGNAYEVVIPREIRTQLQTLDNKGWDEHIEQGQATDDLRSYVKAVVDLRGIAPLFDVVNEFLDEHPAAFDPSILKFLLADDTWLAGTQIDVIYNDGNELTYLISGALSDMVCGYGNQIDGDLIDELLDDQACLEPHPATDELLAGRSVCEVVFNTAEGRELLAFLDDHVPEDCDDETFAPDIVYNLTIDLRKSDDLTCLDRHLDRRDLRAIGDVAAQLYAFVERLNLVVPKWRLNGWSYAELKVRSQAEGDSGTAPLASSVPTEPEPTTLRDFSSDAASGFTWIGSDCDPLADEDKIAGEIGYDSVIDSFMQMLSRANGDGLGSALDGGLGSSFDFDEFDDEEEDDDEEDGDEGGALVFDDSDEGLIDRLHEEADRHLDEFDEWLEGTGLKPKTIERHVSNLHEFLHYYLADYEGLDMQEGIFSISGYLGEFFIRKMMWSTPATIRSTAASIKKFYKCMHDCGHISKSDLDLALQIIKDGLPEWCATCADYNDPYTENPFAQW